MTKAHLSAAFSFAHAIDKDIKLVVQGSVVQSESTVVLNTGRYRSCFARQLFLKEETKGDVSSER